jgi:hypothetical protein
VEYAKNITSPVKIFMSYRYPVSGSFTVTAGGKSFSLDFGDGTQDNKAIITKDGVSKEITLRK